MPNGYVERQLDKKNEELVILRKIAHLANEYRKHKMYCDLQEMKKLAKDWSAKYA